MIVLERGVPAVNSGPVKGKKLLNVTKARPVKKTTSQSTRTENTKKAGHASIASFNIGSCPPTPVLLLSCALQAERNSESQWRASFSKDVHIIPLDETTMPLQH